VLQRQLLYRPEFNNLTQQIETLDLLYEHQNIKEETGKIILSLKKLILEFGN